MKKEIIIFACPEHVEMAIDDVIVEKNDEAAPNIELDEKTTCKYCKEKSKYKIS